MYRRPKFLEVLHEIRQEMAREADFRMDLFAEKARESAGEKIKSKTEGGYFFESLIAEKVSKVKK